MSLYSSCCLLLTTFSSREKVTKSARHTGATVEMSFCSQVGKPTLLRLDITQNTNREHYIAVTSSQCGDPNNWTTRHSATRGNFRKCGETYSGRISRYGTNLYFNFSQAKQEAGSKVILAQPLCYTFINIPAYSPTSSSYNAFYLFLPSFNSTIKAVINPRPPNRSTHEPYTAPLI